MWMDHRAESEAEQINATGHHVLEYVGGKISLEMQLPKLMWLKKNLLSQCWTKAGFFYDLPDFMTWRATGSNARQLHPHEFCKSSNVDFRSFKVILCYFRSLCSLVCKWTYQASLDKNIGWDEDFLRSIGLEDLLLDDFRKIGLCQLLH